MTAGSSSLDSSTAKHAALFASLREWTSSKDYPTRAANASGLWLGKTQDDGVTDTLQGGSGLALFFGILNGAAPDLLPDRDPLVFGTSAAYDIHVDNNGDGIPDRTFTFTFATTIADPNAARLTTGPITTLTDPDLLLRTVFTVTQRVDNGPLQTLGVALPTLPPNFGPKVTPNYEALVTLGLHALPGDLRACAGVADDPSFGAFMAALSDNYNLYTNGRDRYARRNVGFIAIQVPLSSLTQDGTVPTNANDARSIIGVWAGVRMPSTRVLSGTGEKTETSTLVPVSRMGHPFFSLLFVPLVQRDRFNTAAPAVTYSQWRASLLDSLIVQDLAAGRLCLNGAPVTMSVPPAPRTDLESWYYFGLSGLNRVLNATVIPADVLRLNLAVVASTVPNRFGYIGGDRAGYPNGRRLGDDVSDIALRLFAGILMSRFAVAPNNTLGDGVDANDALFRTNFPYVGTPWPINRQPKA